MPTSCPKCGWQQVEGPTCARCGVNIAEYRAQMAVASAVARPGTPPPQAPSPRPRAEAFHQAPPQKVAVHPAGFWIRFLAIVIDGLCLAAAEGVLGVLIVGLLFGRPRTLPALAGLWVFNVFLGSIYPVIFHWRWGQTLGKMAVHVKVVTVAGGPLSLNASIIREIGYWVSFLTLCIGYLMAGLRSDKRALHDLMAGTRVEYVV